MSGSLFSAHWYRVAELRPRLRAHATLHRHVARGQRWAVLHDPANGRQHRLSATAWEIAGRCDGTRTVQTIWESACERLGDAAPSQDETIEVLSRLHAADLLQSDVPPDAAELFERHARGERSRATGRLLNPLSIRVPIFDPDPLLERAAPFARPFFGRVAGVLWLALVGSAALLATAHWSELSDGALDRMLSGQNLLLLALVYPLVKLLHEAGHGLATKLRGGEVHETGVMLLAFFPLPYVDASSSAAFPRRRDRMLVAAAGILVELALAALALFAWLALEPGVLRAAAWNVMLIGSVSTLLINGNPLLRFDGYYVLQDAIDVPNLGTRANRALTYLFERHAFGVESSRSPAQASGEMPWLVAYGIGASIWRLIVLFTLALLVAERLPGLGIAIGLLAAATQIGWPLLRGLRYLASSPRLSERRARALAVAVGVGGGLLAGLFVLPLPLYTLATGVVWPPERSQLRAGADGIVQRVLVEPGEQVRTGDPLIETEDPLRSARVAVQSARVAELRARRDAARRGDETLEAEVAEQDLADAEAELDLARERAAEAVLRAPADGTFWLPHASDLPGVHLAQGELVGFVRDTSTPRIRVAVPQADVGLVAERTQAVAVRLAERPAESMTARLVRQVPGGGTMLPSAALGRPAGGPIPVDPSDPEGRTALTPVFEFELELPEGVAVTGLGGRAYVRFAHGAEPLGFRALRALRRTLLGRLGV